MKDGTQYFMPMDTPPYYKGMSYGIDRYTDKHTPIKYRVKYLAIRHGRKGKLL